jgi:NADPH:quinone reductase-like Zn-dependent oxidoreductase
MENRKATIKQFGSAKEILISIENHLHELKPNEVLIKIEASTVSATDIIIRKGIYPLLNPTLSD